MTILALVFIALSAALHIYIWVLEQFFWDKPRGMQTFGLTQDFATATKELAANQGFYNLLLAVVMLCGIGGLVADTEWGAALCFAGSGSTVAAGTFLAVTSPDKMKAGIMQLTPGLLGCIALTLALI